MGRKEKKRAVHMAGPNRRVRQPRRRQRSSSRAGSLLWVAGVVGIVAVIMGFGLWQVGAFAKPSTPSRSGDPAALLPLAETGQPLRGGHDMALIPEQTPAPRAALPDERLPRLDMPSASHDFGRIPSQQDVVHIFAVQNTGATDLLIGGLVTSCGCTTAELSSSVIPPGQRADLMVTFDPDFHEVQGEVVRLVWFATNDPTQPWVEVRITADVE